MNQASIEVNEDFSKPKFSDLHEDTDLLRSEDDLIYDRGERRIMRREASITSVASSVKVESTYLRTSFNMIKSYIGVGILSLPFNFWHLGFGTSFLLMIYCGIINYIGMAALLKVCDSLNERKMDYPKLTKMVLGKKSGVFCEINLFITQIGACIACLIYTNKFLTDVLCSLEVEAMCNHKAFQYLIMVVLLLSLASITDLHHLAIPTAIGTILQFVFLISFAVKSIAIINHKGIASGGFSVQLGKFDLEYLPIAIGAFLYAVEGVGCMLEIRNSQGDSQAFWKVFDHSFVIIMITYLLSATLGCFAYGSNSKEIIFLSLPKSTYFLILEFGYILGILLGLQTTLFPVLRLTENWKVLKNFVMDSETGIKSKKKRLVIRYLVNLACLGIAIIVPSFNLFISFLGSFSFILICCIFPGMMYLKHFSHKRRTWFGIFNYINVTVGILVGLVVGSYNGFLLVTA